MITTTLLAFTGLLSFASAQTLHNVTVGANGQLRFDPQSINATKGDTVQFIFSPKNHTVTQSAFNPPCVPLAGGGGFNSGFKPVAADATGITIASYTLSEDTTPLWFYCEQVGHCGQGMVFAINAPATGNTFEAFQAAAIKQNGTSTSSGSSTAAASSGSYSVAPPQIVTVTETVVLPTSTYVTTYASWPGSAAPTPDPNPKTFTVQVGAGGALTYSPSNISAEIGDKVTFVFNPKNHTVTQSSFLKPCETVENGFDSGFNFATTSGTASENFTITVNTTAPIWVYCRQEGHCGKGMVFAVNAVADSPNNFTAFQKLALSINGSSTGSSSSTGSASSSTSSGKSGATALNMNLPAAGMVAASLALAVASGFLL